MPEKKKKTTPSKRVPLHITDTTLRDAHQSLWATRMRGHDIMEIIDVIDSVGYYSLEVWGGATFDACLRFLRENPWERLRQIKKQAKKTPLQMLLRGQNVLGYRNYPDDLLEHFVALACENGVDIFRIFDALNDTRNLENAIKFVKKYGGHAQGTLSYTISPVHTVAKYVEAAKEQAQVGIDSLCVKDMAGILSPIAAEELVSALTRAIDVPIQLHCHMTSGMAIASYVEGVRAGAGAIDCAISPMAGYQSQPPVETLLAIFDDMSYHATLDIEALREICKFFLVLKKERMLSHQQPENVIDPEILIHHIPGGMISNLRSQLDQQNALDRLGEVFQELPKVRKDLGYPPLVTPTSQIVGTQATLNVMMGERYKMIPQEVRDYVKGLYGRAPAEIDPKIKKLVLGDEKPITCRPADLLEPMLPTATKGVDPGLIQAEEDIISYCLFPEPATEYFKWRAMPPEERPPIPADLELEEEARQKTAQSAPAAPPPEPVLSHQDTVQLQGLMEKLHELNFAEMVIRRDNVTMQIGESISVARDGKASTAAAAPGPETAQEKTDTAPTAGEVGGPTINSPLGGTYYETPSSDDPPFVAAGTVVEAGDTVCIVEAMKLFNEVKAESKCRILEILVKHGDAVQREQPLIRFEPL